MWVNIKVSGLLASFGEAFPLAVPGVYYWCILLEDYVEELVP
jgi:hypothetical protein